MSIKTLIFDWDGTLHRTSKLYRYAVQRALDYLVETGYAEPKILSSEETDQYLGMNAADMWNVFMPDLPDALKKQGEKIVGNEIDMSIANGQAILYEGVEATLDYLKKKGYEMVVLSNCRHNYIEEHRGYFKLDRWFSEYYAAQDYGFCSKEEIFKTIAKCYLGEYAVIGDRASDIRVGVVHGIFSVGCLYGYGNTNELSEADVCINNIEELQRIF